MRPPPAVSVIVPTFERRDLVLRAVRSVLAQSYRDFELIVVDDGSTDGTREALAALDVTYLWQENRGAAAARNAGLAAARGGIVALLDSDDRWLPDHLAVVVAVLGLNPEAVLAGTCPGFLAAGRGEPADARLVEALPRLLIANDVGYLSCAAVRRTAVESVGGFTEGSEPADWNDFVTRLALLGPFALLRRRTVVPQETRGSLIDRGRSSGRYLEILGGIARRTAGATRGGPLGERAAGAGRFFDALQALNAGHRDEARVALVDACARFPQLSREPVLVGRQLLNAMPGGERAEGRLAVFSAMAELWPEPASETAGALRAYAVVYAVRAGQAREAARLARSLRPADARLVVRRRREIGGVLRRSLAGLVHRGSESALAGRGSSRP